ncbi:acyl-CoA thioesterase [candidate division KSB1 bacterium]|nr:acyl-CoA thioesterase [candidate division KSB1 bacterium]
MKSYPFKTNITVQIGDINYGGHLGNEKSLVYFQEARLRYLKELGASEMNIGDGVSLTQIEAFITYKNESFYGDELTIGVIIDDISKVRFRVSFQITRRSDEKLIGTGYTVLAGFDYKQHRIKRIPQSFIDKVTAYQNIQD